MPELWYENTRIYYRLAVFEMQLPRRAIPKNLHAGSDCAGIKEGGIR